MRAAILTAHGSPLSIEALDPLPLGPTEVRVAIEASGVCHSDVSIASGDVPIPPPLILGHEGAGRVVETGAAVSRVRTGDRVIASFVPACGSCPPCLRDESFLCEATGALSARLKGRRGDGSDVTAMSGLGTFADEMVIDEINAVPVHTDLPSEQLALIGCGVTTGVGAALNTARVEPGATVAVIGCGGVGQSVVQGARIAGAARIIAVDPVAMKRDVATTFGATDTVDPTAGDVVEQIQALTGGRGADHVFEVTGRPEVLALAFRATRRGGAVVVVGMAPATATVTLPAFPLFNDGKRILGCMYGSARVRRDFPRFVALAETGRLDLGAMVSRHVRLEQVDDAFEAMLAGEVVRSVVVR